RTFRAEAGRRRTADAVAGALRVRRTLRSDQRRPRSRARGGRPAARSVVSPRRPWTTRYGRRPRRAAADAGRAGRRSARDVRAAGPAGVDARSFVRYRRAVLPVGLPRRRPDRCHRSARGRHAGARHAHRRPRRARRRWRQRPARRAGRLARAGGGVRRHRVRPGRHRRPMARPGSSGPHHGRGDRRLPGAVRRLMRVAVFHPGTQHSYETALGFQRAGELAWYATEIFYDPLRFPYRLLRLLPRALQDKATAEFRRRYNPHLDPALVRTFGIWEWIERASMRVGLRRVEHYANEWGNRRVGSRVGAMAGRGGVEGVWGCDASSRTAFRIGKSPGIRCVLEQTIGHPRAWNRILTDEREQMPADFDSYPRPYPEADLARVDEEIALADHVCCGSAFVKSTMSEWGVPGLKVSIIPYGVRAKNFTPAD